jgi:HEAT repeat protein
MEALVESWPQGRPIPLRSYFAADEDGRLRTLAIDALQEAGAAAIPTLADVMRDEDHWFAAAAADALEAMGPAAVRTVPALLETLAGGPSPLRSHAVRILGAIGPAAKDAIPALTELVQSECDGDVGLALRAISALIRIADPAHHPVLTLMGIARSEAEKGSPEAAHALELLAEIGPAAHAAAPVIAKVLDSKLRGDRVRSYDIMSKCCLALSRIGRGAAVAAPVLVEALHSAVTPDALHALEKVGLTEETVETIAGWLSDRERPPELKCVDLLFQLCLTRALRRSGPTAASAVPVLVDMLEGSIEFSEEDRDDFNEHSWNYREYLGYRDDDPDRYRDDDAYKHLIVRFRATVIAALREIGPPAAAPAVPALARALRSRSRLVRGQAASALAAVAPRDDLVTILLIRSLNDRDAKVRRRAEAGLTGMGFPPSRAPGYLKEYIADEGRPLPIRSIAYEALKSIAPAEAAAAGQLGPRGMASESDLEAYGLMRQLKAFYLVFKAYDEGWASLRKASQQLSDRHGKSLDAEELPRHFATIARHIKKVNPLFAKIFDRPSFNAFTVSSWKENEGESYKFSEEARQAWEWTHGFLRRQIGGDWFGFSPLTTSGKHPRG